MKLHNKIKIFMPYLLLGIVILAIIYYDAFDTLFFYDIDAPDLKNMNAIELKYRVFHNFISIEYTIFELGRFQSFLIPMVVVATSKSYYTIKEKYLKLSIGKNNLYAKNLFKSKVLLSLLPMLWYTIIFIIICVVAIIGGRFELDPDSLYYAFAEGSILRIIFPGKIGFLLFNLIFTCIGIFANSMLCMKLVDFFNDFIRPSMVYLVFIWLGSLLFYRILPSYFVLMSSFMVHAYYLHNMFKLMMPLLVCAMLYNLLNIKVYEV